MTLLRISKIKRVCVMHLAPRMFRSVGGAPGKFHRLNYVTVWNGHGRDGADDARKIRKVVLPPSQPFCHVGKPKMPYEILPQHLSTTRISENKVNSDSETTYPADKKGNSVITLEGVRLKDEKPSALEDKSNVPLRDCNIKMIKLQATLIKITEQALDYCDMNTKHFKIAFNAESEMNDKAAAITQMNENYLKFCPESEETQFNISFDDIMTCKRTPNTLLVRSSVKEKKKTEKKKEKEKITEKKDMPLLAATIVSEENKKFLHYFNKGVLVNLLVPTELEISGSLSKGSVKKELKEPSPDIQTAEEIAQSYIQARASPGEQVAAPCNVIFEDPLPDINLRDETVPLIELLQRARERNRIMYCREMGQQLAVHMKTFMAKCPPAGPSPPQKPPYPQQPPFPSPWPPLCPPPFALPFPPPFLPPWPPLCPPACPPPCPKPCPPCPPPECPKPCGPNLFPPPCPPPMSPPINPPPPFLLPQPLGKCPPPKCPPPTCPAPPPPKCPPPPPKCPPPPPKCPPPPPKCPPPPPKCPPPPPKCPPPPCPPPKCPPPKCSPPKCPPPKGLPPPPPPPPPPKCPPPPPKCPPPPPKCSPPPPKCPPPPPKCPPPKPKCPPPCPPPKKRPKRECPPGVPPKCKPPKPKCPPPPRECPPPPKPKPKCPVPTQPPPKCPPPKCPDPPKCRVEDAVSLAAHLDPVEKFPRNVMLPVLRLRKPDFRSLQNRNDVVMPRDYLLYIFRLLLKTFTRS